MLTLSVNSIPEDSFMNEDEKEERKYKEDRAVMTLVIILVAAVLLSRLL